MEKTRLRMTKWLSYHHTVRKSLDSILRFFHDIILYAYSPPLLWLSFAFPECVHVFLSADRHPHAVCPSCCKHVCPTPVNPRWCPRLPSHCSRLTCDILPHPTPHTSSPVTWYLILDVSTVGTGIIWFPRSLPAPHPEGGQEMSKRNVMRSANYSEVGQERGREEVSHWVPDTMPFGLGAPGGSDSCCTHTWRLFLIRLF